MGPMMPCLGSPVCYDQLVKAKLLLVLVFAVGLLLGLVMSPWRYQLIDSGQIIAYRIDHLTGDVDLIDGAHYTRMTKAPSSGKVALSKMTDEELKAVAKKQGLLPLK